MLLIKRYPNRKLYDTESKQYITLDGIAEFILRGKEVHVIDNVTGEDLTALTLSQIIFEKEKKQSGFLPRTILTGLIQAGGDRLTTLQRNLIASLGIRHIVDEEIKRRVHFLTQQGVLPEAQGVEILTILLEPPKAPEAEPPQDSSNLEQEIQQILNQYGIPSRQDYESILSQLDSLASKLDDLSQHKS